MKRSLSPVLIVDDQDATRQSLKRILEKLGIDEVETAGDGSDALFMLDSGQYGLVISDWHMSTMGGLQLLRQLRASERFAYLPFIMITADAQVDVVLTARQAGADAVVLKPFTMQALRTKIGDVVRQKPYYARPPMPRVDHAAEMMAQMRASMRVA
jgi:two-component system chemotaxis response regulator CheY